MEPGYFLHRPVYFSEWVYAAYLQWSGRWKVFELSAGLRAEQTFIEGDSKSADTILHGTSLIFSLRSY
ncbi:MAG: outer membrane beta-barrel protein [Bacteroidetes bacterium]|nr:outer membrane beta-barrel protein [Bacteroidota bacterium]